MPLQAYEAAVLAAGPRAYWPLQEAAGLPQDISGNGLHMTAAAGTRQAAVGPCGDDVGWRLTGGQSITRSAHVSTVVDNLTLMCWWLYEAGSGETLLYNGNAGANGWGFGNYTFFGANKLAYLCGGVGQGTNSLTSITTGSWIHCTARRTAGTWRYLLNGVLDGSNPGATVPVAPNGTVTINGPAMQGLWAHPAIFETALSDSTVAAIVAAATTAGQESQSGPSPALWLS